MIYRGFQNSKTLSFACCILSNMKAEGRKEALWEFTVSGGSFIPFVVLISRKNKTRPAGCYYYYFWGHTPSGASEDASSLSLSCFFKIETQAVKIKCLWFCLVEKTTSFSTSFSILFSLKFLLKKDIFANKDVMLAQTYCK